MNIIDEIRYKADQAMSFQERQINDLKASLQEQTKKLTYLTEEETKRQILREQSIMRKERRRRRTRLPIKDSATYPELERALNVIESNERYKTDFARSRDKVALFILYVTGMRIGELNWVRCRMLDAFLLEKTVTIMVSKSHDKRREVPIGDEIRNLAEEFKEDMEILKQNKQEDDLVFTAKDGNKPIERSWMSKRINHILALASKGHGKLLKASSFRIGFINVLIETCGIEKAQTIIGHNHLSTTKVYSRTQLTPKELMGLGKS